MCVCKQIHVSCLILHLGGNPAAVCLLEKDIADTTKQKIAAEMNLSETAFVIPSKLASDVESGNKKVNDDTSLKSRTDLFQTMSRFSLRWFTPTSEVPLCGHATLASAVVLFFIKNNQQVYIKIKVNVYI